MHRNRWQYCHCPRLPLPDVPLPKCGVVKGKKSPDSKRGPKVRKSPGITHSGRARALFLFEHSDPGYLRYPKSWTTGWCHSVGPGQETSHRAAVCRGQSLTHLAPYHNHSKSGRNVSPAVAVIVNHHHRTHQSALRGGKQRWYWLG